MVGQTLLEALRQKVGPDIPICASLDLHANVTARMVANADGLFSYRTYPHVDAYDTGKRAAAVLQQAMDGNVRPRCLVATRPQIVGANHGFTAAGPMVELIRRCGVHGDEPGILDVSVNAGFPWADIEEAGPSVTVTYGDDGARAREIAEAMMDTVWDRRAESTLETVSVGDAIAHVVAAGPGEGGYGDSAVLLLAMLEAGFDNAAFGYWKVTVERPLRIVGADPNRVYNTKEIKELKETAELSEDALPIIKKIHKLDTEPDPLHGLFETTIDGRPAVVEYEPDSDLRDTEQIPLQEEGGIDAFMRREVLPHAASAWYVESRVKIGYEISFTRYFYKPQPMRSLKEIAADIAALEHETEGLLGEIIGSDSQ